MKQYKRLLAAGLMVVMIASLTGCATNNKTDETVAENIESVTETTDASTTGTADAGVVHIATKPMTEQFILGEMLSMLIEQAGYKTEITKGVGGGTNNIQPAMESGEFDLYPEYTSSGWVLVLNHEAEGVDDDAMFEDLKKEYEENFDMTWIGKYGFNNTFTVAVRGDVADKYNLKTTSDLAAVAGDLTFGGNPDYIERQDGSDSLRELMD